VGSTRVFALSVHADYACRHSGACCTAGWNIPVEGRVRDLIGVDWLAPDDSGACPQYDRSSRLCRIHRDHGESMLPESCFQFPRRTLVDARGTFVTLSHFCPTAAAMLADAAGPLTIVADPQAFPPGRSYDGLDGRNEWPPLLRPDVLFDAVSYEAWEEFLVGALSGSSAGVTGALDTLASTAERVRAWTPQHGPLLEWTRASVSAGATAPVPAFYDRYRSPGAWEIAARAVPQGLQAPPPPDDVAATDETLVAPHWEQASPIMMRYIASKAFASWTAYQGRGIRTQIAELFLAASVFRVECARACRNAGVPLDRDRTIDALRASDWLLMHLVDRTALMAALAEVEVDATVSPRD